MEKKVLVVGHGNLLGSAITELLAKHPETIIVAVDGTKEELQALHPENVVIAAEDLKTSLDVELREFSTSQFDNPIPYKISPRFSEQEGIVLRDSCFNHISARAERRKDERAAKKKKYKRF